MASDPYFDKSRAKWRMKWWSGAQTGWKIETLCEHPGWVKGAKPPRRPPPEAERLARKYRDLEIQARHGVEVAEVRALDLKDFLEAYSASAAIAKSPGTIRATKVIHREFLSWCQAKGIANVPQVTAEVCRTFLDDLARTRKRSTVGNYKNMLAPAWSMAAYEGKIAANPWIRAKVPGKARVERPPFWSEEEVAKLIGVCKPWLADLINVGVASGLRISALLSLEWDDVDFTDGVIRVRAVNSKSGKAYNAPLLGRARDVLERLHFTAETKLVFAGPVKKQRMHPQMTFLAIQRAVKRAGINDFGHYNHALRHTFGTWAVNRGVPLKVVSQWLGHASITMTEVYAHADPTEMRRWAARFGQMLEATPSSPGTASPPATGPYQADAG
ncbi:tyrosine-type recombinase/integrase [Singulisphaera sp. PoT]|uniref:tyrosine-type recombinase/integrase n=1 Tax=Singulisphaera sp. PoT TaxID=3411797 RepID=UPI003BF57E9A